MGKGNSIEATEPGWKMPVSTVSFALGSSAGFEAVDLVPGAAHAGLEVKVSIDPAAKAMTRTREREMVFMIGKS